MDYELRIVQLKDAIYVDFSKLRKGWILNLNAFSDINNINIINDVIIVWNLEQ